MTQIIERAADRITTPEFRFQETSKTFICRAIVVRENDVFVARAVRMPGVEARADSRQEAVRQLGEAYRQAVEVVRGQVQLTPIRETPLENAVQFSVQVNAPTLEDINSVFEQIELTDEQSDALDALRASGTGHPTIALVRMPRP
jgi:hypothetical protein